MADSTVKKSRIVSDDTTNSPEESSLQDIINQEFNERLKSCMVDVLCVAPPLTLQADAAAAEPLESEPPRNGHHQDAQPEEPASAKDRFLATVTDLDPEEKEETEEEEAAKAEEAQSSSVKGRMFLSTDSACLLFTQTVQSPMLTPTDDGNYDFLQGLRTKEAAVETPERRSSEDLSEAISEENLVSVDADEHAQTAHTVFHGDRASEPNSPVMSNIPQLIAESIPKPEGDVKRATADFITNESNVHCDEAVDGDVQAPDIIKLDITEVRYKADALANFDDCDVEIVEKLATDADGEEHKSPSRVSEISKMFCSTELQRETNARSPSPIPDTADTVKRNKQLFENGNVDTNVLCSNSVVISKTVTSESSVMETSSCNTTVEEKTGQEKTTIKKKKSKKSKKDSEKENISVCDSVPVASALGPDEATLSHVSVKNLCRSFSDLTDIGSKHARSNYHLTRPDVTPHSRANYYRLINTTNMRPTDSNAVASASVEACAAAAAKSSFSKFDALSKKTVLHVRSSDSSKAQEKFNGSGGAAGDGSSCKQCGKVVFQMEQIKAEKAVWHRNCFRCRECNKQLNVDTYQSNEGVVYCKPHFKALFSPKVVEESQQPVRPRRHELIIRENQPEELPPDVVRASDKPDLGLEELQNLNVKERFQVFEHHETSSDSVGLERTPSAVNVKRSPSILSKLAKFQSRGAGSDIGVSDEALNGGAGASSEEEAEESEDDGIEGEDAELIRAKRQQREKPMHFSNMSDMMNKWESGGQLGKEERREERKQEIQSIRSRLFMGKQGKMKEMYQQAVAESESGAHVKKQAVVVAEACCEPARSIKERFERGGEAVAAADDEQKTKDNAEDMAVFESAISKKSRSIFLELDANASKPPQMAPLSPAKSTGDVRRARQAFMGRQASEDVVRSSDQVDDVTIRTADISNRFKFFEGYKEPQKERKAFRITPPRDGQLKEESPEQEIYRDPDVVRHEEAVDDSELAQKSHTATKMLSIFRQMEENLGKESAPAGPKPLKRFTPPPEPTRDDQSSSGGEESDSEGDDEPEDDDDQDEEDEVDAENGGQARRRPHDEDLIEAQKAARAKQLRAKFERWEANELQREHNNSSVNIAEEFGEEQSQIESAKSLRARFESMRETSGGKERAPRVKVNRFVDTTNNVETCKGCEGRVYPLEKVSCHNTVYHKNCFRCRECNTILRMDSFSYNQGLLYCTPHFKRLFIAKGDYETGFGLNQPRGKWNSVS